MATTQNATVVGIFDSAEKAQKAVQSLRKHGFADDDIGIVARDWSKSFRTVDVREQKVADDGAAAGAAIGGGLGAILGLVGAIAVPVPLFQCWPEARLRRHCLAVRLAPLARFCRAVCRDGPQRCPGENAQAIR